MEQIERPGVRPLALMQLPWDGDAGILAAAERLGRTLASPAASSQVHGWHLLIEIGSEMDSETAARFDAVLERARRRAEPLLPLPAPEERRQIRQTANLTTRDLAEILGVAGSTVVRWESGQREPQGDLREKYAAVLEKLAVPAKRPENKVAHVERVETAEWLTDLRRKHGLSREKFARVLDVSYQTVMNWENGRGEPRVWHLRIIHARFGERPPWWPEEEP